MDPATHDLFGQQVDGWYWQLTEEAFQESVRDLQASGNWRAAAIVDRLVATADDIPAQLMAEYQGLWNDVGDEDGVQDSDFSPLITTYDAMIDEIARGAFKPADATAFVTEFIFRMTRTRAS